MSKKTGEKYKDTKIHPGQNIIPRGQGNIVVPQGYKVFEADVGGRLWPKSERVRTLTDMVVTPDPSGSEEVKWNHHNITGCSSPYHRS